MLRTPMTILTCLAPFVTALFVVGAPEPCCTAGGSDVHPRACCCPAASADSHTLKSCDDARPKGPARCPDRDSTTCRCTSSPTALYAVHQDVELTQDASSWAPAPTPERLSGRTDEPVPPPPKPF